jgi:hypothetical protein
MAQQDFVKLASQGRAFDGSRAWTEEELEALIALTEHGLQRLQAADYVRNGIRTVAEYEKAVVAGVEPKSLETVRDEAVAANAISVREAVGLTADPVEPEAEAVVETPVVEESVTEPEAEEPVVSLEVPPKGNKGGKK